MSHGIHTFLQKSHARREAIRQQVALLGTVSNQRTRAPVERALKTVEKQLGESLLPDLSDAACQRAAQLVGFRALISDPPARGIAAERERLLAELQSIEADPAWQERAALAHPETGTLTLRVAELEEQRRPALDVVTRCNAHERFEHLLAVGYDTPTYAVPFWRAAYYRDWEAGDQVVEAFADREKPEGPALRFRDVVALYGELKESLDVLTTALNTAQGRLDHVGRQMTRHAEATAGLESVEARHLEKWRARLVSHVQALGLEHQDPSLLAVPELARQVKVLDGLAAKLRCLGDLERSAGELAEELRKEADKLKREEAKYARPKKQGTRFTDEELHRRFTERPAKLGKKVDALSESGRKVTRFDRWDEGRIGEPFDWTPYILGAAVGGVAVAAFSARDSAAAAATAAASNSASLLSRDAS